MATQGSVIAEDEELDFEIEEDTEEELEDTENEESEEEDSEEEENTEESDETEPRGKRVSWEERFKGLQAVVQQRTEEAQALRNQLMLQEAQTFQQQIQGYPEDQQAILKQLFMNDMASKYRLSQAQDLEQRAQEAARQLFVREKAQEYGVPVKLLEQYDTPQEIEHTAKQFAAMQKRNQKNTTKQVKKASGNKPKFGSGGTGITKPRTKAQSLDEAASRFAKYKIEI